MNTATCLKNEASSPIRLRTRRAADPIYLPPSTGGCPVGSSGCQFSETIHVRPEAISSRTARPAKTIRWHDRQECATLSDVPFGITTLGKGESWPLN
jgi:hypothetical protein